MKKKMIIVTLRSRYQGNLETLMRGSDFIFDSAQLVYYKCDKVNFRHDGSYIDSTDWRRNKKATIYPKDAKDKCFQYAVNVAVNYE